MSEIIIKTEGAVIRQQKNTILKNVNIEIKSGEFVYIIGKVGSGKSSFLKTLYAELPLEYGKAEVAGFQLSRIKKSQVPLLRRKCGIVFQDFRLLTDRTVYSNLEFVLRATGWNNKKNIRERIENVLEKVEMTDKKDKMPHQLSGGEQQRIVLARALLNAPPLILADEPTGNIDPETSYRLVELLKDICENGKTIIIATHQYDLIARYPGRVLRCENSELIEDTILSVKKEDISTEQPDVVEAETNLSDTEEAQEKAEVVIENTEVENIEEIEEIIVSTPEQEEAMPELQFTEAEVTIAENSFPQEADDIISQMPETDTDAEILMEEIPAPVVIEEPGQPETETEQKDNKKDKDNNNAPAFGFELIE